MPRDGVKGYPTPDDAGDDGFDPADSSDWTEVPNDPRGALDELAAAGAAGGASNVYKTVTGDSGSAVASGTTDTLAIEGGDGIATAASDGSPDSLTIAKLAEPFVTNVTGSGAITDKTYESDTDPASKILESCSTDNDTINVAFEVTAPPGSWQPPSVTVTGGVSPVQVTKANLTRIGDSRRFSGTASGVSVTSGVSPASIKVTTPDGAESSVCTVTRELDPPLVTAAIFDTHAGTTGGDAKCPGLQTFSHGVDDSENNPNTCRITGTTEAHATHVYVKDYGATDGYGLQGPFTVTSGAFDFTCYVGDQASGSEDGRVYAVNGIGTTPGDDFDTTNTLPTSQTLPAFGSPSITYPGTQEALKDFEDAEVTLSCTNWDASDDALYSDNSTGELEISNAQNGAEDLTTYQAAKWAERASGNYRESGANYKLTVTRSGRNGTVNSSTTTIKIAHTFPVISVNTYSSMDGSNKRLRTDDGTDGYYDHDILLSADQATLSTDTPELQGPPVGTFQGGWIKNSDTSFERKLQIADGDIVTGGQGANTYTWSSCSTVSWVNRAGKETTTVTTNNTFYVGGFDERTLTIAAWPNRTDDIGVLVVDTSELVCENLSKGGSGPNGGTIFAFDNSPGSGNTPDDETDKFCIVDASDLVDDDHQHWYNKDYANAESNTSGTASVLIEEEV